MGVPEEERPKVLEKLLEDRFIDDTRFAKAYVSEKTNLNCWGTYRLRQGLRMKGVSSEIIDEKIESLNPELMTENLEKKLEKKLRQTRTYRDRYDLRNKLIRHGLTLGYDYPSVKAMADKLLKAAFVALLGFLCIVPIRSQAQVQTKKLDPTDYVYPVLNVARLYSANFGEMRPGHFHSGIDIKTDGVVGKPVVAAADGYIARIAVTAGGFGRAVYIAHPNGTTTVYAHLDSFRDDIERFVLNERYRTRQNNINIFPPADKFPLKQGEQFARAGNTGSSSGPHLHYEIRDSRTQRTLNMIAQRVIRTRDDIPPRIARLHYIAVDTVRGVPVHSLPRPVEVVETSPGNYHLKQHAPLTVGGRGYFVLEVIDRKNDVSNSFGVWRTAQHVDSVKTFEFCIDGFLFNQTRYCNAVTYFPLQKSGNEFIRLTQLENCIGDFYPVSQNRGLITPAPGETQQIVIEAEDDSGNVSTVTFSITGQPSERDFRADADSLSLLPIVTNRMMFHHTCNGMSVQIPAGALYEPVFYTQSTRPSDGIQTTTKVLSPIFSILSPKVPLHNAMTLSIRATVPESLQPHACLALVKGNKVSYAGGRWRNGAITGSTRSFGDYCVVADTLPPTVTPKFSTTQPTITSKSITFELRDNFSGVGRYSATIDGQWILLERNPMRGTITHTFDDTRTPKGRTYALEVVVTDNCGNKTTWRQKITR